MSSLRNAVKRITHKERPQPTGQVGFLERKKDYKKRAQEYHLKQDRINALKEKAAMKNPDEFYFGMHKTQVVDGQHRKTLETKQKEFEEQVGYETIRIMKDQDLSYIRMQRQKDAKKVEKMRANLQHLDEVTTDQNKRKHTIFLESQKDVQQFDVAKHFDTVPEFVNRTFNRPRIETLLQAAKTDTSDNDQEEQQYTVPTTKLEKHRKLAKKQAKALAKARSAAYSEFHERTKRIGAMERAEAHLVTEKLVASKGRKRKIKEAEGGQPAQYKWRRKRQR